MKMKHINTIQEGDCLDVLKSITPDSIDLIYLDPPFFTDRKHKLKNRERTTEFSFDDIWESDREYAEFLYVRMVEMRKVLRESGTIFVHCDKSGEHIVRALLDRVFGEDRFQSEIIWYYKRWSNSKKGLLPAHQNIYFYSKSKNFKFNTIFTSYSESTNVDQILQDRTRDEHNKSVYKKDKNGKAVVSGEKKGVPLSDVWDIPYLNPKAKERVGYPTQKPLLLLERIIELASDEGDVVLDPFCGSGTTCVAAKMKNRSFIGIDISSDAVELSNQRLDSPVKTESKLMKKGRDSYLTADQDALKLLSGLDFNPIQRNKGIDAILVKQHEGKPILIRVQKTSESIHEAANLLLKAMKKKQSVKSFLIRTHQDEMFDDSPSYDGVTIIDAPSVVLAKYL
jgi:site-specific DNA-methyltransferase (adenine-specific)